METRERQFMMSSWMKVSFVVMLILGSPFHMAKSVVAIHSNKNKNNDRQTSGTRNGDAIPIVAPATRGEDRDRALKKSPKQLFRGEAGARGGQQRYYVGPPRPPSSMTTNSHTGNIFGPPKQPASAWNFFLPRNPSTSDEQQAYTQTSPPPTPRPTPPPTLPLRPPPPALPPSYNDNRFDYYYYQYPPPPPGHYYPPHVRYYYTSKSKGMKSKKHKSHHHHYHHYNYPYTSSSQKHSSSKYHKKMKKKHYKYNIFAKKVRPKPPYYYYPPPPPPPPPKDDCFPTTSPITRVPTTPVPLTNAPTIAPVHMPTEIPSLFPSFSVEPSMAAISMPTAMPSRALSVAPSIGPTAGSGPTRIPTSNSPATTAPPVQTQTLAPTLPPITRAPTSESDAPSFLNTASTPPSMLPSNLPSELPSIFPSSNAAASTPTGQPTLNQLISIMPSSSSPPTGVAGIWNQVGNDIDGEAGADLFGTAVSLSDDGRILAVGATLNDNDTGGINAGTVYVYQRSPSNDGWLPLGQNLEGTGRLDRFGWAVDLSGDGSVLAATSIYADDPVVGDDAGQVRVFSYDQETEEWNPLGEPIVGSEESQFMGDSVALSRDGRIVAVGATRHNGSTGQVRIFEYDSESASWVQLGSDINGAREDDLFGTSVSLSADGSIVAIGSPLYDGEDDSSSNAGVVQVYVYDGFEWLQRGDDIVGLNAGDIFGSSVSLSDSGLFLAAGARRGLDEEDVMTGYVRVFTYSIGTQTWNQRGETVYGKERLEEFGHSVSISNGGSSFAAGAPRALDGAGATRIYAWDGSQWAQEGDDIVGENENDNAGASAYLSGDGKSVAIGARSNDDIGTNGGQVRVYENTSVQT